MLKTYEKFRISDENKEKDFFFEVNWDKKNKDVKDCRLIKVTFPDGSTSIIKKETLNSVLFILGNPEEQRKMIPQKITRSRAYETVISIEAKKDIKRGEQITFPLKINLPDVEEEVIAEIKKKK